MTDRHESFDSDFCIGGSREFITFTLLRRIDWYRVETPKQPQTSCLELFTRAN